jgi:electron transport complex protein RnfE
MLMHAFVPDLYESLGVFLSLIVVNCIILGRAEMYASKNPVVPSIFDGLGMGVGFTAALLLMGTIR